jgi:hypothetical protein
MQDKSAASASATSSFLPVVAVAFAIAIFLVDTLTTLDIAVAVLYVVVVLMAAKLSSATWRSAPRAGMYGTDGGELFVVAWPHRGHGSCQMPDEPFGDRSHDFPRREESIHERAAAFTLTSSWTTYLLRLPSWMASYTGSWANRRSAGSHPKMLPRWQLRFLRMATNDMEATNTGFPLIS